MAQRKVNNNKQVRSSASSAAHFQALNAARFRMPGANHSPSITTLDHKDDNQIDWMIIKDQARRRCDRICPICLLTFLSSSGQERLLSCSHLFHRQCLRSLEKFAGGIKVCPICRTSNYQTQLTSLGSENNKVYSICMIQALMRGYLARVAFRTMLREYYRGGTHGDKTSIMRKRFYEQELSYHNHLAQRDADEFKCEVDQLFRYSSIHPTYVHNTLYNIHIILSTILCAARPMRLCKRASA